MAHTKINDLTFEELNADLSYDPENGTFTWKVDSSKNVKAGSAAGCYKGVRTSPKTGTTSRYLYIRFNNFEMPAARVAWILKTGKWPTGNVLFRDGDTTNFKWDNLKEAMFSRVTSSVDAKKKSSKMSSEAQRHYGLQRFYGLSLAEYGEKLVAQGGVCAICKKGETAVMHGKLKPLSVDHNHETGAVRDLLCSSCNHLLGHAREKRDVLLAAAEYLEHHAAKADLLDPKEGLMQSSTQARALQGEG